jgi:hypothetical protein
MLLENAMPDWVCQLCRSPLGISGTITALSAMGDTPAAQDWYQSLAARLTAWSTTIPGVASDAVLPDFVPLPDPQ